MTVSREICLIWLLAGELQPDVDFTALQTDTPKLSHLCKDRPRARKTHHVQKPMVAGSLPLIENIYSETGCDVLFNGNASSSSTLNGGDLPSRQLSSSSHASQPADHGLFLIQYWIGPLDIETKLTSVVHSPQTAAFCCVGEIRLFSCWKVNSNLLQFCLWSLIAPKGYTTLQEICGFHVDNHHHQKELKSEKVNKKQQLM